MLDYQINRRYDALELNDTVWCYNNLGILELPEKITFITFHHAVILFLSETGLVYGLGENRKCSLIPKKLLGTVPKELYPAILLPGITVSQPEDVLKYFSISKKKSARSAYIQ